MREESHLEDMRDAIRGDFERLAERRGEQELMRLAEDGETTAAPEPEAEPDPTTEPESEPEPLPEPESEAIERRSWLARLFST